mmetsp:Transcript_20049/g.76862  ORF Transcript_20049/g.76862 Transcript_20049/m.76862 type:complete len:239 (+) Transcript_20049:490-1206(+)
MCAADRVASPASGATAVMTTSPCATSRSNALSATSRWAGRVVAPCARVKRPYSLNAMSKLYGGADRSSPPSVSRCAIAPSRLASRGDTSGSVDSSACLLSASHARRMWDAANMPTSPSWVAAELLGGVCAAAADAAAADAANAAASGAAATVRWRAPLQASLACMPSARDTHDNSALGERPMACHRRSAPTTSVSARAAAAAALCAAAASRAIPASPTRPHAAEELEGRASAARASAS